MWIDEGMCKASAAQARKRGHPLVYSDALIQGLLGLKQVFHLPLRALQGFAMSLRRLAYPELPVPNYTTLSRRAQDLQVVLPALHTGEPVHMLLDSTGLKVFGEGEWKVRKHGWSKRRTWRKVHLAMDAKTGQICAALMTHQDVGDADVRPTCSTNCRPTYPWTSSAGTARTTASSVMRRLPSAVRGPRFHRAKVQVRGLKPRPARHGATLPSTPLPRPAGANGRRLAATTGARWWRT